MSEAEARERQGLEAMAAADREVFKCWLERVG